MPDKGGEPQADPALRRAEAVYVALVLGVAGLIWQAARKLPPAPYDPLGPASFPLWVSYGLAALGLAMGVRLAFGLKLGRSMQSMVSGLDGAVTHVRKPWTAALTLLLAFAYAGALSFRAVPFMLATAVYLFAAGAILGAPERKRLGIVALFAIIAAIVLDLAFRRVFKLDLS